MDLPEEMSIEHSASYASPFARVANHWLVDVLGGVAYGVGGCCTKQGMPSPGDTGSWIRSSADGSAFG